MAIRLPNPAMIQNDDLAMEIIDVGTFENMISGASETSGNAEMLLTGNRAPPHSPRGDVQAHYREGPFRSTRPLLFGFGPQDMNTDARNNQKGGEGCGRKRYGHDAD